MREEGGGRERECLAGKRKWGHGGHRHTFQHIVGTSGEV